MAGKELADDIAELEAQRRQGVARKPSKINFQVLAVEGASPSRVLVHTRETWSDEVYDLTSRRLLRQDPPSTYAETYTVELVDGRWIVTNIDLAQAR